MKIYTLTRKQVLPITLEQAWPFFSTPTNLEQITPAFLRFHITSVVPDEIYPGLIITYRIAAVAGIPVTWVTEIKQVIRLRQFVDEQRIGPFRFWHHLHRFNEVEGGVEMEDIVHYVMPWGWLGRLVHALFVRARLKAIFDFRREYLEGYFNSHPFLLPYPSIGVSAIIFDQDERVLLIRRGKPPASGFWHFPGGKLEAGEGLVEGVRREVKEETGLDVNIGPIMAVVERRQEGFHYVIIDFLAHLADPNQTHVIAADDASDAAWVAEDELDQLTIADGLLPILERARLAHRGERLGLVDAEGLGTDFIPIFLHK